ncbi:MAG: hypothetical protein HY262_03730 [Chloroflexi bacterium]|nr:hypothetical protein [Chloroflexota bacterium]
MSNVTLTQDPACAFHMEFSWTGFGGRDNLMSNAGLYNTEGPIMYDPDLASGKSGSNTADYTVTGVNHSSTYYAAGWLTDIKGRQLQGSFVTSDPIVATCP